MPFRFSEAARGVTVWSAGLSLSLHGVLVVGLAVLTRNVTAADGRSTADTIAISFFPVPTGSHARPAPATTLARPVRTGGLSGLSLPTPVSVPHGIRADPSGSAIGSGWFVGAPSSALGRGSGTVSGSDMIVARLATEPPMRLSGPPPRYPPLLRTAGIAGEVTLEFVVDTAGHPEPGSLRVVTASHKGFVSEARVAILGSVYRPGRLHGHPVRVLVRQTVVFRIDE